MGKLWGRPGDPLKERELELLQLIADGRSVRQAAVECFYSHDGAKMALRQAVHKLGARNKTQACAFALRQGLIR